MAAARPRARIDARPRARVPEQAAAPAPALPEVRVVMPESVPLELHREVLARMFQQNEMLMNLVNVQQERLCALMTPPAPVVPVVPVAPSSPVARSHFAASEDFDEAAEFDPNVQYRKGLITATERDALLAEADFDGVMARPSS